MYTCPKCNQDNPELSNYCSNCGFQLSQSTSPDVKFLDMVKKPKSRLFLIFSLVLIVIISFGLYQLIYPSPSNKMIQKEEQHLMDDQTKSVQILGKIRCKNLAPEVKMYGVHNFWLVSVKSDSPYPLTLSYYQLIGKWYKGYEETCPK